MNETTPKRSTSSSEIRIRRYRPQDRRGVLTLDQRVWNRFRSEAWFIWKYEQNPYVDRPPVFLAEDPHGGEIVGARPLMPFRLRIGGREVLALQPSDTMVHPDYRGQGLFTAMTERALSAYRDGQAELCFNFPNRQAGPGYERLGWREVGSRPTYYRVHSPARLAAGAKGGHAKRLPDALPDPGSVVSTAVTHLSPRYRSLRRRLRSRAADTSVETRSGVDIDRLVSLYEQSVPAAIHASRDVAFYRWRFASPVWRRCTYVARHDGQDVAGLVVRIRRTETGVLLAQVADVVPLRGDAEWAAALYRLLSRVVRDYSRSDLVAVAASTVPHKVLSALGFLSDDRPPLSWVKRHHRRHVVRPLDVGTDDSGWTIDEYDLTDSDNWRLTFLERDAA